MRALVLFTVLSLAVSVSPAATLALPAGATVSAIRRDAQGNVYLAGSANAANIPPGEADLLVAKVSPAGDIVWSKTLGGSQGATATALALAPDGTIVVVGSTTSRDFPVTPDAAEGPAGSDYSGLLLRFSPDGALLYASYLNSNRPVSVILRHVFPLAVAVDSAGNSLVAGQGNFSASGGAVDGPESGLFLAEFDSAGRIVFTTGAIGGSVIYLDGQGFIYLAGYQVPREPLPITPGAFQSSAPALQICGGSNGPGVGFGIPCLQQFVAKVAPGAKSLVYATWLSGSFGATPVGIFADSGGNAIVAGTAGAPDYPVTPGAFQTSAAATGWAPNDIFAIPPPPSVGYVSKLNASGTGLIFSTMLGGSVADSVTSMSVDAEGAIYLSGIANSPGFPGLAGVPGGCLPSTAYGLAFLTRLTADGSALSSTRLGYSATQGLASSGTKMTSSVFADGTALVLAGNTLATLDLSSPPHRLVCITDAADQAPVPAIAPGQLLSLYVTGLEESFAYDPAQGQIPTSPFGDSAGVLVHGIPAPILYWSQNQINIQVPYEIAGQTRVKVEIDGASGYLDAQETDVAALSPSAFTASRGFGSCNSFVTTSLPLVALNADGSRNECDNPAAAGSIVTLFLNGLGVASGLETGRVTLAPAIALPVPVQVNGNATLVDATSDPGSPNSVWNVRLQLGLLAPGAGAQPLDFQLTAGGVPVLDYVLVWGANPAQ